MWDKVDEIVEKIFNCTNDVFLEPFLTSIIKEKKLLKYYFFFLIGPIIQSHKSTGLKVNSKIKY